MARDGLASRLLTSGRGAEDEVSWVFGSNRATAVGRWSLVGFGLHIVRTSRVPRAALVLVATGIGVSCNALFGVDDLQFDSRATGGNGGQATATGGGGDTGTGASTATGAGTGGGQGAGSATGGACAGCGGGSYCDAGSCVPSVYGWVTGSWGTCSATCDGGFESRSVQCVDEFDQVVSDSLCTEERPDDTRICATQPCCVTGTLAPDRRCSGHTSDIIAWDTDHYGDDTGGAANQAACRADCAAWASAQSYSSWCCDLVEDSTTGHSYTCAAHWTMGTESYSNPNSEGAFAGTGSCSQ